MFRILAVIALFFTSIICFAKDPVVKINTGIVVPSSDYGYFLYTPRNIMDTDIIFMEYNFNGQVKCCVKINGNELAWREKTTAVSDESGGQDVNLYIPIKNNKIKETAPKISIIFSEHDSKSFSPVISRSENNITVLVKGMNYYFSMCNSQEGVHIYSVGNKVDGHLYYPLGYEVKPTCPKAIYDY
ncbi:hypothetical protein [Rahnella laticis]|uniref:hypothetical protein n=1 Tax=Rahnella laticis TaxID=2787622 RepID=UPI0018A2FE00|nr:hypothetical protein [Rahnella laticis]MBF7997622.1 hypothetical protein [Rahnella laticis]